MPFAVKTQAKLLAKEVASLKPPLTRRLVTTSAKGILVRNVANVLGTMPQSVALGEIFIHSNFWFIVFLLDCTSYIYLTIPLNKLLQFFLKYNHLCLNYYETSKTSFMTF